MEMETIFTAAIQSSFLLGLLHGVNPCGHSWLVLAPFVSGETRGRRVTLLTTMFLGGTAVACLLLGASLGAVSRLIPGSMGFWVEIVTSVILLLIGALLLYNPHILHSHTHDHDHDHKDDQGHQSGGSCSHTHQCHGHEKGHTFSTRIKSLTRDKKLLPIGLFIIGFVNMIIPCPTAAVMYTYALNSGSVFAATLVFATYAASTAIAVGAVIFLIFQVTSMAKNMQKDWVEPLIMRAAGIVIILFSGLGLYQQLAT